MGAGSMAITSICVEEALRPSVRLLQGTSRSTWRITFGHVVLRARTGRESCPDWHRGWRCRLGDLIELLAFLVRPQGCRYGRSWWWPPSVHTARKDVQVQLTDIEQVIQIVSKDAWIDSAIGTRLWHWPGSRKSPPGAMQDDIGEAAPMFGGGEAILAQLAPLAEQWPCLNVGRKSRSARGKCALA
ncbi:hypothetical protein FQR65_LT20833 [Abscondita terminalis]|nr:hypothetical protein FQR65_LT20833 [Abscondita terminalis]